MLIVRRTYCNFTKQIRINKIDTLIKKGTFTKKRIKDILIRVKTRPHKVKN